MNRHLVQNKKYENQLNLKRKISYDLSRRLSFNNFSSNLIKYLLEFFTLNEYIEIKKVCINLNKIISSMNIFQEYICLTKKIKAYPKNIPETIFKDNAVFITAKMSFEKFLLQEEKTKLYQNFLHYYLRNRKTIYLPDTLRIGEMGFFYLATYLCFLHNEIEVVNLNYNLISDDSIRIFSDAIKINHTLKNIHLNGTNLPAESCKILAEGIAINKNMEKFEMSYNNNLRLEGVEKLFTNLKKNSSIETLLFCDNSLRKEGAKVLAEFIKENKILKKLFIEKNEFGDDGMRYIAEGLIKNKSLRVLNLSENRINHSGLKFLSQALNHNLNFSGKNVNTTLTHLFLKSNSFNNLESSKLLGDIVENNKSLIFLDLSNNYLSENSIKPLSEALKANKTLENLILETNGLGSLGSNILCEGLKYNTKLKFLNLRNNSLGFEGAKNISDMLAVNKSLESLNLQSNLLDEHSISVIADKIGYSPQLKSINISYNQISNIQDLTMNLIFAKDILIY